MRGRFLLAGLSFLFGITAVVLATLLLLPVLSSARGSDEPTIAPSYAASQGTASLSSSPVITIGMAALLSGGAWGRSVGWAQANSVQLAVSQTNAAGGINMGGIAHTLVLVAVNDGCDPTQAIAAANALLNAGAVAVVGHTCSGASMAAQALYNAAGVAMISPSSTDPAVTQQGYTTTFRTVPHDGTPAILLATYFRSWLGFSKSAVVESDWLAPGDAYSIAFTNLGGTITSRRAVTDPTYFTATLTAIQAENPNVVFYSDLLNLNAATGAGQFSKIAHELGMTGMVIGWNSDTNDESVLVTYANAAGPVAAENDHAVMRGRRFQDMPRWTSFLALYQAAGFTNSPADPGIVGAYAYDAAGIIIAAMERADSANPAAIRDQIAATRNYEGVVGTYQGFDANGDPIPQWAWLERYRNGHWQILNPSRLFLPMVLKKH
jgi:branched-chain amino acid transport system substrate-binding protein